MDDRMAIRKNILDTDLQKYLQLASGSVIIAFTYLIAVVIASSTRQINWNGFVDAAILSLLSVFVIGLSAFFFIKAMTRIKRITKAIKDLEKYV